MYPSKHLSSKQVQVREAAEARFFAFVKLVAPWLETGHIHEQVCDWMQKNFQLGLTHQLILLPRGHLKSTLAYLWVCWRLVKNPALTVLYASASHKLAEMQTNSMQAVLEGPEVSLYWPNLINPDKGKRDVWRLHEFTVDHPYRKERGVRDYTLRAMGIGHNVTGAHGDLLMLDDVVAPEAEQASPWTKEGRQKLETWYSFMTSVLNPGGEVLAIGTRYHAKDLYHKLTEVERINFDTTGGEESREKMFQVFQRVVETNGQFLWPRRQGKAGDWYGFDARILAGIQAGYLDKAKFYSQYYQNPVDPETQAFAKHFSYYDPSKLVFNKGRWFLTNEYLAQTPLNVFTAVDVASTTNKDSDYTAVVTVGVDPENNRYILDIDRFQTDRLSTIIEAIFNAHNKWKFRRVRIEVVAAQRFLFTELRDQMRARNVFFGVEEYRPPVAQGRKQERIVGILEPLYANAMIKHFRGGNCEVLEEELVMDHPPHDDIADALAMVSEICVKPVPHHFDSKRPETNVIKFHRRFGGVAV